VRPTTSTAGEPFTLVVEVVGWGNIDGFVLPKWTGTPETRLFPPSTKRERRDQDGLIAGRVVEETLVQTQRPGTVVIPALHMTVFDPAEGRFTTVASEPVRVVVGGDAATTASSTVKRRQVIGAGARPLALGIDPRGRTDWALAPRLGGLTLGVGLVIGSLGWWRRRRTESAAGQLVRRMGERAAAARDAATAVDLTAAHRLLLDTLADRCGDDVRACVAARLPVVLTERGLDARLAARVAEAIVRGESARFAPGGQRVEAVTELVACIQLVDEPMTRSP
jgi:hypothetical protein